MTIAMTLSTIDRQEKPTSTRMDVIDAATDPQIQTVADTMDAVILGQEIRAIKSTEDVIDAGGSVVPTDKDCNRGQKWLMRFQDATGKKFTHEIGTADSEQLPTSTADHLDLSAGVGLALKNALDAIYQSPQAETGVLLSVQQVTRTD